MVKRIPKRYGFFDTETYHKLDMKHDDIDVRVVGNTVHVFVNGVDTGEKPTTYVKCACLIGVDAQTRAETRYRMHTVEELLCAFVDDRVDRAYSHNYRFDGAFIMSYLMENNNCVLLPNGWYVSHKKTLMGRRGVIYEDTLEYVSKDRDEKSHRHLKHTLHLRDSAKIWNSSLRQLGHSFGELKGDEALSVGVTEEIMDYCMQDCNIIKKAIMWTIDEVRELTDGKVVDGYMTSASMAYGLAIHWLKNKSLGFDDTKFRRFMKEYLPPVDAEHGFPDWMRKLYKGATPLLNKRKVRHLIRNLRVYDVNSMYPKQMHSSFMPMCSPRKLENPSDVLTMKDKIWFAKVRIYADVKRKHRATFVDKTKKDTLQDHMCYPGSEDPNDTDSWCYITNVDFDLIKRDYNIEHIEVVEAYTMKKYRGMFEGFIIHWYEIKKTTDSEAMRAFAKLIINSLYGKFGTRKEMEQCEYGWNDGVLCIETLDETVENTKDFYLPIAIWTTAYARDLISRACNILGFSHVVYTDTDSLHIIGYTKEQCEALFHAHGIGTTSTTLGDFKDETGDLVIDGIYIRNKGYYHFWQTAGTHKEKRYSMKDGVLVTEKVEVAHEAGDIQEIKMAGANEFPGQHNVKDILGKPIKVIQRRGYRVHGGILILEKETEVKDVDECLHVEWRHPGKSMNATMRDIAKLAKRSVNEDLTLGVC